MIIEGQKSLWLAGQAHLVSEDRDLAWAERTVHKNPAFRWVLGRYVEADRANNNRQMWQLSDLREAVASIHHSPINMLHAPRRVVGHYADAELLYPTQEQADDNPPFVEALGVVYKYYFPQETAIIERAHDEGKLFYSMECVAESLTCAGEHGCGNEFEYKGPSDPSYCEHINSQASIKQMNNPWFLGGALLVPPVNPGWKDANVFDISAVVKENAAECEKAYEGIEAEMPHGDPGDWEALMAMVVGLATQVTESHSSEETGVAPGQEAPPTVSAQDKKKKPAQDEDEPDDEDEPGKKKQKKPPGKQPPWMAK